MTLLTQNQPALEMRVVITTSDFERLKKVFCNGLGLDPTKFWDNDQGRAIILDLGRVTLEIFDESQAHIVDEIEAGHRLVDR